MLGNATLVQVVCDRLTAQPHIPVIADTVIHASSGAALLDDAGVQLLRREHLPPRAQLITPNRRSAHYLAMTMNAHCKLGYGTPRAAVADRRRQRFGIAGELRFCTDVLITADNVETPNCAAHRHRQSPRHRLHAECSTGEFHRNGFQ